MTPTIANLNREVSNLHEELRILRSFIIGVIDKGDKEGKYRPDFVKKTLKAASERAPFVFSSKKLFLKNIQSDD